MEKILEDAVKNIAPNQPTCAEQDRAHPTHPTQAAGVLVNAQTGEIVASGSYPSYDPKIFEFPRTDADNAKIAQLNKDPAHPLLNQVIQGQYAPGLHLQAHHHLGRAAQRRGQLDTTCTTATVRCSSAASRRELRERGAGQDQPEHDDRQVVRHRLLQLRAGRLRRRLQPGGQAARRRRSSRGQDGQEVRPRTPRRGSTCRPRPTGSIHSWDEKKALTSSTTTSSAWAPTAARTRTARRSSPTRTSEAGRATRSQLRPAAHARRRDPLPRQLRRRVHRPGHGSRHAAADGHGLRGPGQRRQGLLAARWPRRSPAPTASWSRRSSRSSHHPQRQPVRPRPDQATRCTTST